MALLTPRAESRKKKTTLGLHQKLLHFNLRIRQELQTCKRQYLANAMQVYGTIVNCSWTKQAGIKFPVSNLGVIAYFSS